MSKAKAAAPERRKPGRPSKLTYELGDQIVALIREGNYVEVAAQACGVSKARLYDWSSKAAEHDDATDEELEALDDDTLMFVWFRYAYKEAEAIAETELLREVREAEQRWQAPMTIMQRRFGKRWRDKTDIDIEHSGGIAATKALSPEEQARELAGFGMEAALAVAAGPDAVQPPGQPNA